MDRRDAMLEMFDATGFGLEIGPSYNPLLPKGSGYKVEVLDHADQATLFAKYKDDKAVDASLIEVVDHVSDGRSMIEVIGGEQRYDFIVASHVIEHTPNPLGFLKECEQLLRPDGVIFLAVPDKRFCFDHFRPVSTTGMVLLAQWERRTRHVRSALFDQNAHYCEVGGRAGWSSTETRPPILRFGLIAALTGAREREDDPYIDCHGWQFTPSSFRLLVSDLADLGELQMKEQAFKVTPDFEFFVTLSRDGAGPGVSRQALLEAALLEGAPTVSAPVPQEVYAAQLAALALATSELEAFAELRGAYAAKTRELSSSQSELDAARREIHALQSSTSWQITAPLRAIKRQALGH